MAVPDEVTWPIEPHTAAKHKILRAYLDAWLPILGRYGRRIYLDGFSGPGEYKGGEPGSPIIALEAARTQQAKSPGTLEFVFVEERGDRVRHLGEKIAKLALPAHIDVNVEHGTFANKLGRILDDLDADRNYAVPMFALVDPFGFSGIPYTAIRRLLSRDKCEVLTTFMVDAINRWLDHPNDNIRAHIVEAFGTDEAISIAEGSGNRANALKKLYQRQLNKVARFVRYFEMRDRDGRIVYYLFFASNNALGHVRMKEAMWKVDPLGEFTFSDSTNPNQTLLFKDPSTSTLVAGITAQFKGLGQVPVERVERYVHDHTAYLRKHMREVLGQLETDGKLQVAEIKADGKKRRAKSFPNTAFVTFH